MAKFQLADMLKDVSDLNTGREQIVYIDPDKLLPDPDNFYSLEGLEDLAANIELVGLQQPPRVRPNADDSYTIVSGHRRRAAIQMIRDGGSDQFAAGVPCIVELQESGSKAWQELRLIFANSATRVMTSADLSKQAERVTELLYQLKQEGVEFPGRMRAHVAAACQVSESKLARLHAIRTKLDSNLLLYFDRGDLNEDAAYKLSQFPDEIQFAVGQELINGRRKKCPSGVVIAEVLLNLKELQKAPMKCRAHAGGPDCHNRKERIVRSIFSQYSWNICTPGKCCIDCHHANDGCSGACHEAKARVKKQKQDAEQQRKTAEENRRRRNELSLIAEAKRFLPLVLSQEWPDDTRIPGAWMRSLTVRDLKRAADGDFAPGKDFLYDHELVGSSVDDVKGLARSLGCTVDFVLGVSDDPHVSTPTSPAPIEPDPEDDVYMCFAWRIGNPPINAPGWYAVKVQIAETDVIVRKVLWWNADWFLNNRPSANLIDETNKVVGWFPLPDDAEEG